MSSTSGRYGGVSAERRRSLRRETLLDAALDVLGELGVSGVSMRAVCSRAGLNDRYFYESFTGVEQMLVVLFDEQMASALSEVSAAVKSAPSDMATRVRAATTSAVAFTADDPRRARLLIESQATAGLRASRAAFVGQLVNTMLAQVAELCGDDVADDQHAYLAMLAVAHGEIELLIHWLRGDLSPDIDRDTLTEFLVTSLHGTVQRLSDEQASSAALS